VPCLARCGECCGDPRGEPRGVPRGEPRGDPRGDPRGEVAVLYVWTDEAAIDEAPLRLTLRPPLVDPPPLTLPCFSARSRSGIFCS